MAPYLHKKAHWAVQQAVRNGTLIKPDHCSICMNSTSRPHAHHKDYSKPLDVEWLCIGCHSLWHTTGIKPLKKGNTQLAGLLIEKNLIDKHQCNDLLENLNWPVILSSLTYRERIIIELYFWGGWTLVKIGKVFNFSHQAITYKIAKAARKLFYQIKIT